MSPTEVQTNVLIDRIDDDAAVLKALGHDEELNRQFSFFSLAAYATITSNAWVSVTTGPQDRSEHGSRQGTSLRD
jgi:hypothetical protein